MPMKTKEEQREYQRQWVANRRRDWIESQGGHCAECGAIDELEVDHIDRSLKTMQPASIWSRTASVREAELANCQVLCVDCHMQKTIAERDKVAQHGTNSMYTMGCRCLDCKAAHAAVSKEWKRGRVVMQQPAKL